MIEHEVEYKETIYTITDYKNQTSNQPKQIEIYLNFNIFPQENRNPAYKD